MTFLNVSHRFYILSICVFILAASFGSFFRLVADRYNSKDSFIFKGSFCPDCKNKLYFWHNIPIVSYLLLGGKCFFCKSNININNFYSEIITGFAGLTIFLCTFIKHGANVSLAGSFVFFMILILLSMFDLKHRIVPHEITYLAIIFFVFYKLFLKEPYTSVFFSLGIAFLALDVLCFLFNTIKNYEMDSGLMSFPLLAWTICVFFSKSFYSLFIPVALYFALSYLKNYSRFYKLCWISFLAAALALFWKLIFVNHDLNALIFYFSGIGIIYFVCEIFYYFVVNFTFLSSKDTELSDTKKIAFGGGDVTVFALISVFFGYKLAFIVLFIASLLALLSHLIFRGYLWITKKSVHLEVNYIPFVPYLTLVCFIILVIKIIND